MSDVSKWMKMLQSFDNAVLGDYDPYSQVIRSPSPSVNFVFGNSHGLPLGFCAILYGPPKAGKTLLTNAMIGQLHRDYPDAIAIKFDTEMREMGQMKPSTAAAFGIDRNRYVCYQGNNPADIFDRIEGNINALCQNGAPIKLIVIDSISGIRGRRDLSSKTVEQQHIGDEAKTIQDGLKRILETIRKNKIALILTTQVRAEMDPIEQMRGNKLKMSGSWYLKHFGEYFVYIDRNNTKDGRTSLLGEEYIDNTLADITGKGESTGHRIRVVMKDSSVSPKGRVGEFTMDYNRGIINTHEEVFLLGVGRGIIKRPNNRTYEIEGLRYNGKPAILEKLKHDPELCDRIVKELIRIDLEERQQRLITGNDVSGEEDHSDSVPDLDFEEGQSLLDG